MNKKLIIAGGLILLIIASALFTLLTKPSEFNAELVMQFDAMAIVNYYQPRRIVLSPSPRESLLKLPEFKSPQPLFGTLVMGAGADTLITIVIDESPLVPTQSVATRRERSDSTSRDHVHLIYVDKNNNQDLTDDGEPFWDDDHGDYLTKEILVEVSYFKDGANVAVPYPISFYRYKNRLHDSVIAYRNGYREGEAALKDGVYKIALLDDDLNGRFDDRNTALIIDVERDGVLNGHTDSPEYFSISEPFNINGVTYRVKRVSPAGGTIVFEITTAEAPQKATLREGAPAPVFAAVTLNGQTIALSDFKNKVVLLDFWASWCKPWEGDLPLLLRNYARYRHRNFEIIGVNLDFDLQHLRQYLEANKIEWPQIAAVAGWQSPLVELYGVAALPKNFLLDRKGVVRYKDLRGASLSAKIYELVNEAEAVN